MKSQRPPKQPDLVSVVAKLRKQGFQPFYKDGRLIDWRRVKGQKLLTAEVTVHASGRVTVQHRSSADGKRPGRKRDRSAGSQAPSTGKVDTSTA